MKTALCETRRNNINRHFNNMLQQREGNYKTPKHFIVAILVFDDVTIKIRFLIIITNWFMDIGGNCWKIEIRESHNSFSNSRIYTLKRLSNSHHDLRTAIFRARWILLLWSAEKKRASGVPLCILSQEKNNRREWLAHRMRLRGLSSLITRPDAQKNHQHLHRIRLHRRCATARFKNP